MIQIFDTFEDFKSVFQDNLNLSVEEKIELWEKSYISKYPELEAKCYKIFEVIIMLILFSFKYTLLNNDI